MQCTKKHINPKKYAIKRDAALRTLNSETIAEFFHSYQIRRPSDDSIFWLGIHKAASGMADINIGEWLLYAQWLKEQGSTPLCDRWSEAERYLAAGGKPWPAPVTCNRPESLQSDKEGLEVVI